MGFHCPVFFRIRTESTILPLYKRVRVSENPYSCIFYAVQILTAMQRFSWMCIQIQIFTFWWWGYPDLLISKKKKRFIDVILLLLSS